MEVIIKKIKILVVDPKAQREWCLAPYPDHPRGCPNYGRKKGCPPHYPFISEIFDIRKPLCAVIVKFNLREHMDKMKKLHPEWSERQCRCCLYYQPTVNKKLREEAESILREGKLGNKAEFGPEAAGMDMTATCHLAGIDLEWPPQKYVCKIAFIGYALK